jgi:hypothetical protein
MLSAILPPKPTPEEIAKAAPLREAARKQVVDSLNLFNAAEPVWKKAGLTDSELRPTNAYKSYLESEVAWWNANVELSPTQVKTRQTMFQEAKPIKEKEIVNIFRNALGKKSPDDAQKILNAGNIPGRDEIQKDINERRKTGVESKKKEEDAMANRTWWDDVKEAIAYALGWTLLVVWIVLAFRFAGFAANDLLYKPLPYRVLSFIYTFIFAPVFAPYYIYREIMHWFYPSDDYKPHFESIFPVVPYDPSEPLTFDKRVYGYADTPAIRAWIQKKQDEEKQSWLEKLQSTIMADLIQQREEQANPS